MTKKNSKQLKPESFYKRTLGDAEKRGRAIGSLVMMREREGVSVAEKGYIEGQLLALGYGDEPNIWEGSQKEYGN